MDDSSDKREQEKPGEAERPSPEILAFAFVLMEDARLRGVKLPDAFHARFDPYLKKRKNT